MLFSSGLPEARRGTNRLSVTHTYAVKYQVIDIPIKSRNNEIITSINVERLLMYAFLRDNSFPDVPLKSRENNIVNIMTFIGEIQQEDHQQIIHKRNSTMPLKKTYGTGKKGWEFFDTCSKFRP